MFSENKSNKSSRSSSDMQTREQNKIAQGTKIIGDIEAKGAFRIEGTVEGTVTTPGKVVIGKSGFINGTLSCEHADFEGKFSGKLDISDTLTLRASSHIEGEVLVGKLAVEPGATFNASCTMKGNVKSLKNDAKEKKQSEKSA